MFYISTAIRREFTRRAKSASADMSKRMEEAERELEEHKADQKAINAGKNKCKKK